MKLIDKLIKNLNATKLASKMLIQSFKLVNKKDIIQTTDFPEGIKAVSESVNLDAKDKLISNEGFIVEKENGDENKSKQDLFPSFEPNLDPNFSASCQTSIGSLNPIKTTPSILDQSLFDLREMDISELSDILLKEVMDLEKADIEYQKLQLEKIFSIILNFQPNGSLSSDGHRTEQQFFVELISIPGLITQPFVREFLENDMIGDYQDYKKKIVLIKIADYYATHSQEAIEKINYILGSSDSLAHYLNSISEDVDLDRLFSERFLSLFDKKDLSQIYRFYSSDSRRKSREKLDELLSEKNDKVLYVISLFANKVKNMIGHSSEFLDSFLDLDADEQSLFPLLNDFYDTFVGDKSKEEYFRKYFMEAKDFMIGNELIKYIVTLSYNRKAQIGFDNITSCKKFMSLLEERRDYNHEIILGKFGLKSFRDGTFSEDDLPLPQAYKTNLDFFDPTIYPDAKLDKFKSAFLKNVYGLSLQEALHFQKYYGKYLDVLEAGLIPKSDDMSDSEYLDSLDEEKMVIMKKDWPALHLLKAINNILDVSVNDINFDEKLLILQQAYVKQMQQKGLNYNSPYASFIVVEGILNNMIMNTYNKRLTSVDEKKLLETYNGVDLLDAGMEFEMVVTSLAGVTIFYDENINMYKKWNTAAFSMNQGLCASHISAENLGIISLTMPILAFNNIPDNSLNSLGTNDIWSNADKYNLRRENSPNIMGNNRSFIPGSIMSNKSRYGYNEILLDRFLMSDENDELKLQPSYLVYYKLDDEYKNNDDVFEFTIKTARDFNIPVMIIDVAKVKAHEKQVIEEMEDRLFNSDVVDPKLLLDILTRYMNNYTGSLVLPAKRKDELDFSIEGMDNFFNKLFVKVKKISDKEEAKKWLDAIESAYDCEKQKYNEIAGVRQFRHSIQNFILMDFDVVRRIQHVRKNMEEEDLEKTAELPSVQANQTIERDYSSVDLIVEEGIFIPKDDVNPELDCIINLTKEFESGSKFNVVNNYIHDGVEGRVIIASNHEDSEILLVENLILSYLFEDTSKEITVDLVNSNLKSNINFNLTKDYDFNEDVTNSTLSKLLDPNSTGLACINLKILDKFISKVENMNNESFLNIFMPLLMKKSNETGFALEELSVRLIDKKDMMRQNLFGLQQVAGISDGNNPLSGPKSK